jgi:hypothetical protein
LLQPAAAANTIAAKGSHAAARFTPLECLIGCPTERRFATVKFKGGSGGFLYLAGADARGANADLFPHARHDRAHAFQVRIPPAPPRVIRMADHVSKMRRFAAELTLQCHFSSCFSFYLGLDFLLELSQNQAPHSSRPSTFGKVRLLHPFFASCVLLRDAPLASGWFFGTWLIARRCHRPQALFFGTGFEREPRASNSSNRIEATGFATNKEFRWPRVPLLPSFPPLNLLLSVRRSWHASRDP